MLEADSDGVILQPAPAKAISVTGLLQEPLRSLFAPMEPAIDKLLSIDRLQRIYDDARSTSSGSSALEQALRLLDIGYRIEAGALESIPTSGPVLLVANHPFGLLEGVLLSTLLPRIRPDVRILANSLLSSLPELREQCIFVNPFGAQSAVAANAGALKMCLSWLERGGLLVAFPAGEVAHLDLRLRGIADPPWNPAVARLAQRSAATVVPMFFRGANSVVFQLAGAIHPGLRTISLPRELWNKRGRRIGICIGRPVTAPTLQAFDTPSGAIEYLRCRTYLLGAAASGQAHHSEYLPPVASPVAPADLQRDVASLPPEAKLCHSGELEVWIGSSSQLPNVLREIGRLREISFRAVGEGAGRSLDLDSFDRHYLHLFLWNGTRREIAGAYRLGPTPDILPRFGVRGLYTSTLFHYRPELFDSLGPSIELGRSFVRPEYQKQYAPLLLLWKGIGRYVASRPECATLFGGVSISAGYHSVSRHLIVRFLEAHRAGYLTRWVAPRNPYRPHNSAPANAPASLEQLSTVIADFEPDGKGVPILVKQYMKMGGKVLGFNVDRQFCNTLDALMMVNLRNAAPAMQDRYLGKRLWTAGEAQTVQQV
jgi:putative hemolysin